MGDIVDFKSARDEKEHKRRDARVNKLKDSFKSSRESNESKISTAEKLKKLFHHNSPKKSSPRRK